MGRPANTKTVAQKQADVLAEFGLWLAQRRVLPNADSFEAAARVHTLAAFVPFLDEQVEKDDNPLTLPYDAKAQVIDGRPPTLLLDELYERFRLLYGYDVLQSSRVQLERLVNEHVRSLYPNELVQPRVDRDGRTGYVGVRLVVLAEDEKPPEPVERVRLTAKAKARLTKASADAEIALRKEQRDTPLTAAEQELIGMRERLRLVEHQTASKEPLSHTRAQTEIG